MRSSKRRAMVRLKLHVREIAEKQGISRTKLSRLSDVNYATINSLWEDEAGERGIMLLTLIKVARVLHVRVDELYTIVDNE